MQQGNWTMGAIKGIDEELANNIGFLPMPIIGAKEDSIPVGIPMYWTVNKTKDEKTQKAAKDFLNWIYTSEKGKDYVINKFGFIPPFKGYEAENLQPKDALAKVTTRVSFDETSPAFVGHGLSIDTMLATAKAYLGALNSYLSQKERLSKNSQHQI